MTEQPEDTPPAPRRSVEVALARMEAKLDVAIAQHQARLEDHARRMAALEQERAVDAARIAANASEGWWSGRGDMREVGAGERRECSGGHVQDD